MVSDDWNVIWDMREHILAEHPEIDHEVWHTLDWDYADLVWLEYVHARAHARKG